MHRQTLSGQGSYEDESAAWFDTYLEASIGGFIIREHGLVTADGHLVAIGVRSPGIPKADPATGAADDFTYRIDLFFDQLDALVVEVDPRHGLTAERRVDAGDGLKGGGSLGENITLSIDRQKLLAPRHIKMVLTSDWQEDANAPNGAQQVALGLGLEESIIENHQDTDYILFAGDVCDKGQPTPAEMAGNAVPYLSLGDQRRRLNRLPGGSARRFETNGNHDFSYIHPNDDPDEGYSLAEYDRHFAANRYHVEIGNIIMIVMGDEARGTPGTISDETVDWWEEIVLANQDRFIITVTHQSLAGTINADSSSSAINITGSERFSDRMTRAEHPAKVNLWLCGHHGSYSTQYLDHREAVAFNGCQFAQIGAHIPSIAGDVPARPIVYWTMHLEAGSPRVLLRQWSVQGGGYVDDNEIEVISPVPLELAAFPAFDGRIHKHPRFDPIAAQQLTLSAQSALQNARQELRLRVLEKAPTAQMEKAL